MTNKVSYEELKAKVEAIRILLLKRTDIDLSLFSTLRGLFKIYLNGELYWEGTSLKKAVEAYNSI